MQEALGSQMRNVHAMHSEEKGGNREDHLDRARMPASVHGAGGIARGACSENIQLLPHLDMPLKL